MYYVHTGRHSCTKSQRHDLISCNIHIYVYNGGTIFVKTWSWSECRVQSVCSVYLIMDLACNNVAYGQRVYGKKKKYFKNRIATAIRSRKRDRVGNQIYVLRHCAYATTAAYRYRSHDGHARDLQNG